MRMLIALADTDGTIIDRFVVEADPVHARASLIDGRAITSIERLGEDVREYIERRYDVVDE